MAECGCPTSLRPRGEGAIASPHGLVCVRMEGSVENIKEDSDQRVPPLHAQVAEATGDVAKATRVVAGIAVAGAAVAAPTGLSAVGVALGITTAPLIVTAAPVLVAIAGAACTVSAAAHLYSKYGRRSK